MRLNRMAVLLGVIRQWCFVVLLRRCTAKRVAVLLEAARWWRSTWGENAKGTLKNAKGSRAAPLLRYFVFVPASLRMPGSTAAAVLAIC